MVLTLTSLTVLKSVTLLPCGGSFSWTFVKTPFILPLWLVKNMKEQSPSVWWSLGALPSTYKQ